MRETIRFQLMSRRGVAQRLSAGEGHGSLKITVDVYGHVIPGEKSHAADRL